MEACASRRFCDFEYRAMTSDSYRRIRFAPVEILSGSPARVVGRIGDETRRSLLELRRIRNVVLLESRRRAVRPSRHPSTPPKRKRARMEDMILRFLAILHNREYAAGESLAEVASMFQCAEVTVRRNMDSLAASSFGHMLDREGRGRIPPVLFTASECQMMLSAAQNCETGHPLARELEKAERQLVAKGQANHLIIEVRADAAPTTTPFWVLAEAIRSRRRCWITYVGHWGHETREFAFEPLKLEIDELIRVSGHVVGDPKPKCLTVGRIASAHLLEQRATSRMKGAAQPFDIRDKYLQRPPESD
jgi:hypothetical protein